MQLCEVRLFWLNCFAKMNRYLDTLLGNFLVVHLSPVGWIQEASLWKMAQLMVACGHAERSWEVSCIRRYFYQTVHCDIITWSSQYGPQKFLTNLVAPFILCECRYSVHKRRLWKCTLFRRNFAVRQKISLRSFRNKSRTAYQNVICVFVVKTGVHVFEAGCLQ